MTATLRLVLASMAAGLIASAVAGSPRPDGLPWHPGWSVVRHPGRQHTVVPADEQHPIHYPRSARAAAAGVDGADAGPEDILLRRFFELHTSMAYEDAAIVATQLIEISPDLAQAHYNHACVMGRLHRVEPALASLERAVELGWRDLVHLSIDPDLDCVRGTTRYSSILSRLRDLVAAQDGAGEPSGWPARIEDLYREVPRLLSEGADPHATVAIIDEGRMVWSATIGQGSVRQVSVQETGLESGALAMLASRRDTDRADSWVEIIILLGLEAAVTHRPEPDVVELARPAGGGVLLLRRSPGDGCGVVVVARNRALAGRIAAVALGGPRTANFPSRVKETGDGNPNR